MALARSPSPPATHPSLPERSPGKPGAALPARLAELGPDAGGGPGLQLGGAVPVLLGAPRQSFVIAVPL